MLSRKPGVVAEKIDDPPEELQGIPVFCQPAREAGSLEQAGVQVARCVDGLAFFDLRRDFVVLSVPAHQLDLASGAGLHQVEDYAIREDLAKCHANSRPGLKTSILVFHFRLPVRHGAANPREPPAPALRARLTP